MAAPLDIAVGDVALGRFIVCFRVNRKFPETPREAGLPNLEFQRAGYGFRRLWSLWLMWHLWKYEASVSFSRYRCRAAPVLKSIRETRDMGFFPGGEILP